jgi:23S rRNA pseudouridine1911/1915/1917 synthase
MKTLKHTVQSQDMSRIDMIVQKLTERSRAQVRGLFDHGCVKLNGVLCSDAGTRVADKSEIVITYDEHRNYKEIPKYHSPIFKIIFEDDALLVIDKSAGYLTEPNTASDKSTVSTALTQYLNRGNNKRHAAVVHRLDRDTSGLLVFGKSERVAQQIKSQFEKRKPKREYVAIVAGHLKEKKGTFKSHLITDKDLNQRSTTATAVGKLAITHYKVTKELRDTTLVSVTLETGRRNQIRVHFAEAGHPVLGDMRYETVRASHKWWKWKRLALHAAMLGFRHPITGEELLFHSKVPEEFEMFDRG